MKYTIVAAALMLAGCTAHVDVPTSNHAQAIHDVASVYCAATGSSVQHTYWKIRTDTDAEFVADRHAIVPQHVNVKCDDGSLHEFKTLSPVRVE